MVPLVLALPVEQVTYNPKRWPVCSSRCADPMPRHDYQCESCDAVKQDVITRHLPESLPCECGAAMYRTVTNFHFNGHLGNDRHNRMYGKFHAGFGEVVHSYEHKQELLKKYDVSEAADTVKGSRSWRDQMPENKQSKTVNPAIDLTPDEAHQMMAGKTSATLQSRLNQFVEDM